MAHINGYVENYADDTIDAIYAGDLRGNVWRLDVTGTTGTYPTPIKLAQLQDGSGNAQPVTSKPVIEIDPRTRRRYVMLGTGRLLDASDITSTQEQTFYAITDGTGVFGGFATAPLTPITKGNLAQQTNTLNAATIDYSTQRGWFINLGLDTVTGNSYRVVTRPTSYYGSVTFVANVLNSDACSPAGTSRVYGVDFANAQSLLLASTTSTLIPFLETGSNVTDIRDLSVAGKHEIIFGDDRGGLGQARSQPTPGASSKRLNWREVSTLNN
jgi:type IV pilus assembly protein PilY1